MPEFCGNGYLLRAKPVSLLFYKRLQPLSLSLEDGKGVLNCLNVHGRGVLGARADSDELAQLKDCDLDVIDLGLAGSRQSGDILRCPCKSPESALQNFEGAFFSRFRHFVKWRVLLNPLKSSRELCSKARLGNQIVQSALFKRPLLGRPVINLGAPKDVCLTSVLPRSIANRPCTCRSYPISEGPKAENAGLITGPYKNKPAEDSAQQRADSSYYYDVPDFNPSTPAAHATPAHASVEVGILA